jgi:hypothetical protein
MTREPGANGPMESPDPLTAGSDAWNSADDNDVANAAPPLNLDAQSLARSTRSSLAPHSAPHSQKNAPGPGESGARMTVILITSPEVEGREAPEIHRPRPPEDDGKNAPDYGWPGARVWSVCEEEESRSGDGIHRPRRCVDCGCPIGTAPALVCATCTTRYARDLLTLLDEGEILDGGLLR